MNAAYPRREPPPGSDPNAIIYLLGIALIAGMALALWMMV